MRRRSLLVGAAGTLAGLLGCSDPRGGPKRLAGDLFPALPSNRGLPSLPSARDSSNAYDAATLRAAIPHLAPLHRKLGQPGPNDWLTLHQEAGQSFDDYLAATPNRPDLHSPKGRSKLYIEPLGPLSATQQRIVALTSDYSRKFFGLTTVLGQGLPLSLIPERARRRHPSWGDRQLLTRYILEEVLAPRLPRDAAAYIAFTASDLWPGDGYNFVYGQATLRERVAVWSIYRNGDPDAGPASFQTALERTLKIAVHEVGHMFSLAHCIAFRCVMNGCNTREESDAAPLALCPQCMAKVCWMSERSPLARYRTLAAALHALGLDEHARFMHRSAKRLSTAE